MDKSKSSNKTPDKPLKTKTSSKFLIQKVAFFGTAKKILNITQDCLLIDSLNNDPKHHEEISFKDIHAIQMSPVYEAEFNIINTKRDSTQLFCANRARCLSEIYIAWDNYIKQEHALQRKTFPTFSVSKVIIPDNHELYIDVDLVVYRTHLQLIHKSVQCPQLLKKDLIEIKDPDSVVSSVTSIPFYSIGRIYKTHKGIIIEMRYSQKQHRLLFYDLEKTNNVINIIQQNYRDYLGRQVLVSSEEMDDKIIAEIVRPNVQKLFFFNAKVYKVLESGHFFPIELAISDDFLIEYDTNTGIVIQKFDFSFVRHIIRMMSGLPGIQVIFDDFTCVTYVPLRQNRGLLASTIFTLASWKRTESATTIQDDFIHGIAPNCRLEMLGWVNNEVELDYEIDLIQKFTDPKDEAELYDSLHEFNLNGMLKTYAESDPKPLLNLINLFCKYSRVFLTQEFMSFWDVYQEYLANIYPFDFEENPHNEHERHQILVDCEKKFKQLNDTFRANYADKGISTILNVNTAPIILYKTEELLKGIIILISSHKLFREMAVNKTEQKKYENFMLDVVNLIGSPFSTLSHLAGSFFRSFCRFPTLIERKNESINKKFALTSRVKLMQNISETLAKRVLIKNEDEIGNESQFILSILACLRILKAFVYDRKDTTNPEDFQIILQYISTPYYFAIFNFLSRYRSLACVYDTTIIINSFFQHCTTRELYKSYQEKFLNNSTLILLHIKFVLSSLSVLQRKISVVLLTHLLQENSNAISLVCRIFPKNLFRKVDFMSNDISKWTLTQWELFFSLVAKNFDTPTEQWTEECREELLTKLQRIDEDINSKFNYCPPHRLHELFDPTFNHNGEFLLNIRWNHEEFEMNYEVLENKILVWKYYLKTLLEDSADAKFTVPITNPAKLWNELNIRFTGSTDDVEMILILKVMVLLYREQNSVIRDLNTMQFWLRCLVSGEYRHCRYLILQLLYTSLSVEDTSVMRFNIKKFVDIGGLKIIADVLSNIYFSEDHNNLTEEVLEKLKTESANNMDYNYTVLNIKNQAYTYSLEKSAMIKLIVNIYKSILYRPIDKTLVLDEKLLYPIPFAKYQIIEPPLIRSLMNVLLVKDDDIVLEVLEFFNEYLCDKFTFKSQTEDTPFYEFLLYNVTPKTTHARFKLALRIYQRITEDLPSEDNLIKIYANFTFQPVPPQLQEEAIQMYPLFRYLPKYMVWRLITVGSDDVTHIYWADSYETPEMIWNTEMRNHLSNCISEHIKSYRDEVIRLSEKNEITAREKVPKYTLGPAEVVHQNILVTISFFITISNNCRMKSLLDH